MPLKVTQAINLEVMEDRRTIFTTARDSITDTHAYEELFSARIDFPAGRALTKIVLGGVEEAHGLYLRATKPLTIKVIPSGYDVSECAEFELIANVPSFFGTKTVELWVANPFDELSILTLAAFGP